MNDLYFVNARKWYRTIYVNPVAERLPYLILTIIMLAIVYIAEGLITYNKKIQHLKPKIVMHINNHPINTRTVARHLKSRESVSSRILKMLLTKYVLNRETLLYEKNNTDVIKNKSIPIQNNSSNEVFKKYIEHAYSNKASSDLSLVLTNDKKIANIHKIEYIVEDNSIFSKIYNQLTISTIPNAARVYFTVDNSSDQETKSFVAEINYTFSFSAEKKQQKIIFLVTSYVVSELKDYLV